MRIWQEVANVYKNLTRVNAIDFHKIVLVPLNFLLQIKKHIYDAQVLKYSVHMPIFLYER